MIVYELFTNETRENEQKRLKNKKTPIFCAIIKTQIGEKMIYGKR